MSREETLDTLRKNPNVSVLIVGAGINGIGTFRELALNGVDVLIIDKQDFCAGTSATSSRMIHGGLRYLENGEFRLVRESLNERNRMIQNAPHAVRPMGLFVPLFSWFSGILNAPLKFLNLLNKPGERGAVVVKIGLWLYDFFTRHNRQTPRHTFMSRAAALARLPKLNPSIVALGMYYDSQMAYAERIGVELILDTEAAAPHAKALNYVSVVGAGGDTVTVRDERTGETFTIKPKLVINAAGPWIDLANRAMGKQTRYIGGTKGSHIIVDHPELAKMLDGKGVYFENKDGRICIIIPLMDKVMIGATDIRADNPEVVCSDEEIDYFLSFTDVVLPGIKLDRSHIVFHFSGVRPLPASDASWTGQISRDHKIVVDEPDAGRAFPVYSLVGGKWTSFRAFGEETADKALAFLGRTRSIHTETMAIGGGKDYPRDTAAQRAWVEGMAKRTGIPVERAQTLFERYGTRAEQVATYIAQDVDTPLAHQPAYSRRELMWVATTERVVHLDDVLLRRSLLAMLGLLDGATLEDAGRAVGAALGWTEGETRAEIERAADILVREHGVPAARLSLPEAQL